MKFKEIFYLMFKSEKRFDFMYIFIAIFITFNVIFWVSTQKYLNIIIEFKEGEIATRPYSIKNEITMVNQSETDKLIAQAKKNTKPVYDMYDSKNNEIISYFNDMFDYIDSMAENNIQVADAKFQFEKVFKKSKISVDNFEIIYKYYKINLFKLRINEIIEKILDKGYLENIDSSISASEDIIIHNISLDQESKIVRNKTDILTRDDVENFIFNYISLHYPILSMEKRNALFSLIINNLEQNLQYNAATTKQSQEENLSSIQPVLNVLKPGAVIIKKGEIITKEKIEILKQSRKFGKTNYSAIVGELLFLLVLFVISFYYMFNLLLHNNYRIKFITVTAVLTTLTVIYMFLISSMDFANNESSRLQQVLFIPLSFLIISISFMYTRIFGVIYLIFISAVLTLISENIIYNFYLLFIPGLVIIFTIRNIKRRYDIWKVGVLSFVIQSWLIIIFFFILNWGYATLWRSIVWSFIVNSISILLSMSIFPLFELYLNIPTIFRLFELSDLNDPIFKDLQIKAPGTYHHSMIVGNMAETAAKQISENSLMARVSSYFHDIGKMEISEYFIENQFDSNNKHDQIEPSLSISIIKSHVKKGVELAKKLRLPEQVIDIIQQHHGTTLIRYFYNRIQNKTLKGKNITKEDCSYAGPPPRSKIAAIVMLADAIEAASRSMQNPSSTRIKNLVTKIIFDRISDGQLSESGLTFNDIKGITDAFTLVLTGIFHTRIEYPDDDNTQLRLQPQLEVESEKKDNNKK